MESEKSGIKICLLVEQGISLVYHSIYMFELLPADDPERLMIDPISPLLQLEKGEGLLSGSAMIRLGSCIYFFGGCVNPLGSSHIEMRIGQHKRKMKRVRFLDTDHLELGLQSAASLNAPKNAPCVFSVEGLIYALDSPCCENDIENLSFERYDPATNKWETLPSPSLQKYCFSLSSVNWCDCATVILDRYVFLGTHDPDTLLVFDISTKHWVCSSPSSSNFLTNFPFGSLFVNESFYQLKGLGSHKSGTRCRRDNNKSSSSFEDLKLVKVAALNIFSNPKSVNPEYVQVIASAKELDSGTLFTHQHRFQWRELFHLGGPFFCYLVTAPLCDYLTDYPTDRGLFVKVFEEVVPANSSTSKEAQFRTLASFSCRISHTHFGSDAFFLRCCAFGSVPNSWVKAPLKEKQVVTKLTKAIRADEQSPNEHGGASIGPSNCNPENIVAACVKVPLKEKQVVTKAREAVRADEQSLHENGGRSKGQSYSNLEKILAAKEEEIISLSAKLEEMQKLIKSYETLLAQESRQDGAA